MTTRLAITALIAALFLGAWVQVAWAQAQDLFRRGYEASTERRWGEAVDWYTQSAKAEPNNAETYFQRAINHQMMDKVPEAMADYERALELNPDLYLAMEFLAKLHEQQGNFAAAADRYAKALPLIADERWRGIVRQWLTDSRQKLKATTENYDRGNKSGSRRPLF
jgi:tetratricopeptide (TPR) repeat protein